MMQLVIGIFLMAMGLVQLGVYRAKCEAPYLLSSGFTVGLGLMSVLAYFLRATHN